MGRLADAGAQARSLRVTEHRPYPLPERPWVMGQTWLDLLFAHWRVPHDVLRPHVPDRLELEQYDGSAWIGLTPFRVIGLRLRGAPPLPLGAPGRTGPHTDLACSLRSRQQLPSTATQEVFRDQQRDRPDRADPTHP